MKLFAAVFCLIAFTFSLSAQTTKPEILAAANGKNYTAADLPPELGDAYRQQNARIAELRRQIFFEATAEILLETEAAARKTSVENLLAEAKAQISAPTDAQIQAVYNANRDKIGERTLADLRGQILEYLRAEAEHKTLADFVAKLKTKYKTAVGGRDVNAPNLKPTEILFAVGSRTLTAAQFERKARPAIDELRAEIYEAVSQTLDEMIFSAVVTAEAEKSGLAAGDLIAREITDKMRDYSDAERRKLEGELRRRLFQKYGARIFVKEPPPFVQNISADDDPFAGRAAAPVTIVMFSDFQCPACAQTHPVLKRLLDEYGDRARLVVRDFPLERHKDAFAAAVAANAARAQGKFFEYAEILYQNQNALDADSLKKYAADLGLNARQFELDLQNGKFAAEVRQDIADGKSYGVGGTPTIFVNGVKVRQLSAEAFRRAIDKALLPPPPKAK